MRISDTGCSCDDCGKYLNPFQAVKIKRYKTIPGKNYPNISSDTTTKSKNILDLCEYCYNKRFGNHIIENDSSIEDIIYNDYIKRLGRYIKTFNIRYSHIARALNMNTSTIAKYFKGRIKIKRDRYEQMINYLKQEAQSNEIKIHLINTYLTID